MNLSIDIIKELMKSKRIQWRGHMLIRMQQRGIKIKDIEECINSGEIIEYYENDYTFPSCLILGFTAKNNGLHVVCAIGQYYVWMITAYYPDKEQWFADLKTRRNKA